MTVELVCWVRVKNERACSLGLIRVLKTNQARKLIGVHLGYVTADAISFTRLTPVKPFASW